MYCNNCGMKLNEASNFCSHCGTKLQNTIDSVNGENTTEESSTKKCNYIEHSEMNYNSEKLYTNQKSKIVAGILGILVGGFGIHRFYLGYIGIGIIQLVLTFVTFGAAAIWGFIEGILILCGVGITTDAEGNRLSDN